MRRRLYKHLMETNFMNLGSKVKLMKKKKQRRNEKI
jgi:hypothetical protein|tara:strand:+ start:273 stop:380 length:108 start_codon:yes stop_codon:yes gene_type:complete